MNIIHLSQRSLSHNSAYLQSLQPQAAFFPVLKSNAYGHGLTQVAKMLRGEKFPYLAIDSYPEYLLLEEKSSFPLLLLGETLPENYRLFDVRRVTFCVSSIPVIHALGKLKKPVKIHIFLDTGMRREGVEEDRLAEFLELVNSYPLIHVEGVLSHLWNADAVDAQESIEDQISLFKNMYYQILDAGFAPIRRHVGNSAGVFKIHDNFFNAYRPGLSLYGYSPFGEEDPCFRFTQELRPVLSLTSRVLAVRDMWPGDGVSYAHNFIADHKEYVATIPFGYTEGLPRCASGALSFRIGKKRYQQVGRVCMNLCSVLVDERVSIGDRIELISNDPREVNSMSSWAAASGTIVYECLVHLEKGMRREIE